MQNQKKGDMVAIAKISLNTKLSAKKLRTLKPQALKPEAMSSKNLHFFRSS